MDYTPTTEDVAAALDAARHSARGVGGAIAIVQRGQIEQTTIYGYSNMGGDKSEVCESTLFPLCSITKQFTCRLLLDVIRNPTEKMRAIGTDPLPQIHGALADLMPRLAQDIVSGRLTAKNLCDKTSGIRDQWAMSVLWGAMPEGVFDWTHQEFALDLASLQSEPGTESQSCGTGFIALARAIETVAGVGFAVLLSERIFVPAGMKTARFCASICDLPASSEGYEGDEAMGYFKAVNNVDFYGDCGIFASLRDMIAYERFLDREAEDPDSLYRAMLAMEHLDDDKQSAYGYGLTHKKLHNNHVVGHAGLVRGFTVWRAHLPDEHISVVVMFNHHASAQTIGDNIIKRLYPVEERTRSDLIGPDSKWAGTFLDRSTRLCTEITLLPDAGEVEVMYEGKKRERFTTAEFSGIWDDATLLPHADVGCMLAQPGTTASLALRRIARPQVNPRGRNWSLDYVGEYCCEEVMSTFRCQGQGDCLYGFFEGFLGTGPVHLMRYVGDDVWLLACPRSMDRSPPGDWTIVFERANGASAGITRVTIGCKVARNLRYTRVT